MAIAFRSLTSTTYAARTNTVLTAPAALADGDILIATIFVGSGSVPTVPTPPTGFTAFGTPTTAGGAGFFSNFSIFWKRALSESGSYTFTHAAYSSQGELRAYSGCLASGTPLGATSNNTGTGSSTVGTGITTTAANSFLLFDTHDWVVSGTLSPPTGMTERFDGLVHSSDQLIVSAGATGNRTQTNGNGGADPWAVRMVELLAATGGGGTSTGTLGVTLDAATAAATGKVLVQGTLGTTLGALTLAGSGTVSSLVATGTLSATLGVLTAAATGKVLVRGTANVTLAPLTLLGTGTNRNIAFGTLATTLGALQLGGFGTVANRANPWKLEPRDFTGWSVETTGSTERITQDGRVRITETGAVISAAGNIRIIERFEIKWSLSPPGFSPWTQE